MKRKAIVASLLLLFSVVSCGGGGGGSDSQSDGSEVVTGEFVAPVVTLTTAGSSWSRTLTNFTIEVDEDTGQASADDEWWNGGPAARTRNGTDLTATEILEQEGRATVKLSLDLVQVADTELDGTVTIDWWVESDNSYFHTTGTVVATRK